VAAKKSKKSVKKKGAVKKKTASKTGYGKNHPCTLPEVCDFLAELSDYLKNEFLPDYTKLRQAVCNVERVAIDEKPSSAGLRFCSGTGGGNEPPDPPPPPEW
jgi:hypothetical protein